VALLVVGVLLRLVLMLSYTPAYLSYPDTWGYARAAAGPLFMADWIRPAGYPAMLAGLHAVWGSLTFTVVVQHLLGLASAVLVYATLLRAGAPRWCALVAAAVPALTLDSIYYEHTLLSETPFMLLVAGALYCGVRSLEPEAGVGWALGCGALIALATTFRGLALFAIPVFVVVMLLRDGTPGRRLRAAGAVAVTAGALLIGYAGLQESQNGYFGLTQGSGWATYTRAAPFADCRTFTPPAGTEPLCDNRDARARPGPDWYAWSPESPGQRLFRGPPHQSDLVGAFGRAAIKAQPRAYLTAVATDVWRYVDPDAGPERLSNGDEPEAFSLAQRSPAFETVNLSQVEPLYGDLEIRTSGAVTSLAAVQRVVRVHGVLVLAAVLFSLLALVVGRGRQRAIVLLLAGCAVVPILMASATTVYNWRYLVPLLPALIGAGGLGAHVVAARVLAMRARAGRPVVGDGVNVGRR
jgi:4-amino-4-deoxy-L-arabinose transferase-like glycosyltransferase